MKNRIQNLKLLFNSAPTVIVALFILSCVLMNLLANKEIYTGLDWLALDCGVCVSWLSFLCMDIIVKKLGASASVKISILAIISNLFVSVIFILVSNIHGNWGQYYEFMNEDINTALNNTIGNTWFVLLGSTIAFLVSSIVNAYTNQYIGKLLNNNRFSGFALRSYISTFIGQFIDNLLFALIVSLNFFGWNITQCITCALTGGIVELVLEIIFSPIGYKFIKGE